MYDDINIEELLPFYALGALDDVELAAVEAYLAEHPDVAADMASMEETADMLALLAEPVAPSPLMKEQLMARVESSAAAERPTPAPRAAAVEEPQPSWFERLFGSPWVGAAATALAALAIVAAIGLWGQNGLLQSDITAMGADISELQADMAQLETQNAALREEIVRQDDVLAIYEQPGTQTVTIADDSGAAVTLTVLLDSGEAVLMAHSLPELGPDSTYQLWVIDGDTAHSGGIFEVDSSGSGQLATLLPTSFDAIGVSIEPAGGSESPTVDQIILLGVTT